jgi:hypothetical protein
MGYSARGGGYPPDPAEAGPRLPISLREEKLLPFGPRNSELMHLARQHDPGPAVHEQTTPGSLNHRGRSSEVSPGSGDARRGGSSPHFHVHH